MYGPATATAIRAEMGGGAEPCTLVRYRYVKKKLPDTGVLPRGAGDPSWAASHIRIARLLRARERKVALMLIQKTIYGYFCTTHERPPAPPPGGRRRPLPEREIKVVHFPTPRRAPRGGGTPP
ncbi:hypothetical protein EVAR_65641_1 [Eumeta japonica]|uniref:Uncharacterized protein n=1 Tax=Eumeta variegata TaxID=151549 RepID=A0A4C1Z8T2_EUMVA|nr:hypothetical protein EVAR_65641_1 [Eumeta japonica]